MLFLVSDKYLLISPSNETNDCSQLALYDLKEDNKSPLIIDLTQKAINTNDVEKPIDDKNKSEDVSKNDYSITCGVFSSDSKYLAVCDNRKQLKIFANNEKTNDWILINEKKMMRNCIKILFSPTSNAVVCGDKSGDVYEYNDSCNESESCKLLLGHCSMLRDLIFTIDSKYLITCDRDEKIRVSHYPNTYNIESYCLGHREFVSNIAFINRETLVSGSGDGSIRLWNFINGKQIYALMCDQNESIDNSDRIQSKFPVKKLVTNRSIDPQFLSISFYKQSIIKIYSIQSNSLKIIDCLQLKEEPIDIQFDVSNSHVLWVLLPTIENALNVYEITSENVKKADFYRNIIEELNSNTKFQNNCLNAIKIDELEGLYKHWFNNVETYLQKKHERQETIKKKKLC